MKASTAVGGVLIIDLVLLMVVSFNSSALSIVSIFGDVAKVLAGALAGTLAVEKNDSKNAQIYSFEDYFKAFISLISGVVFLTILIELVPASVVGVFKNVGVFLTVIGIIILIIYLIPREYLQ